jgi:hypothetical protein
MGMPVAPAGEEGLLWEVQRTLADQGKHLQILDGSANASPQILGRACHLMHNLACS